MSSENNPHNLSRGSQSQKRSSSDDNNISKDKKSDKIKSDEKQNSFDNGNPNRSVRYDTEKVPASMKKNSKLVNDPIR